MTEMKKVKLSTNGNYAEIKNGTIYLYTQDVLRFCIHQDEFLSIVKAYSVEELAKISQSVNEKS